MVLGSQRWARRFGDGRQRQEQFLEERAIAVVVGDASTEEMVSMLAAVTTDAHGDDLFPQVTLVID